MKQKKHPILNDGRNIEEEVRNWLPKRSRTQRFDEVFQLMILVEAILLEFAWTFVRASVLMVIMFIGTLLLWIIGTLVSTNEYTIKTLGFYLLFTSLSVLFLSCIVPVPPTSPTELLLEFLMFGIVIPIIGLFLSIHLISYLGTSVDRSMSLVMVICTTVGYVTTAFLLNLDKFI